MAKREYITRGRLKALLSYDPPTGIWTWLVSRGKAKVGTIAGCLDGDGYVQIQIDGIQYKAHNLAFLYVKGRWPRPTCDHENLVKNDNRWDNLREATQSQNSANRPIDQKNTSGFKGVSFCKQTKKWRAAAVVGGKYVNIGRFSDPETAYKKYCAVIKRHFGEFARIE